MWFIHEKGQTHLINIVLQKNRTMKAKNYLQVFMVSMTLLFSAQFNGQEMNGLTFSEYSGISAGMLNPALLTGSKLYMDINIIGASVMTSNDIAYFLPENNTISRAIKMDTMMFSDGDFKFNRPYNYYDNKDYKYLNASAKVMGPSFMVQYEHHAFGLTTAVRSMHSGNRIPYEMPIIMYEGLEHPEYNEVVYDDSDYSFVSMTWSEIGLSYAFDFINYYDNKLTIGVSARALFGHEAGYVAIEHAQFEIHRNEVPGGIAPSDVNFIDLDAEIGYSIPYDEETGSVITEPLVRGYGAGFDIGLVFTKKESIYDHTGYRALCTNPYQDYKFKLGISILDIGSVTFKEDAHLHKFEDASLYWAEFDTTHFLGFEQVLKTYSEAFYGDSEKTNAGDKIKIGLPTTISLQFDYKLKKSFYLSAIWNQPIRFNLNTLWRPSQIAITPRYETRYVGVSLPVSLYNYSQPRIGLAVRVYTLTVGSDWLGSLMGLSDFTGMDIYFSMKFNLVKGDCLRFKGSDW